MSIQGSLRTLRSPWGHEYDVDDGVACWTLEENLLQRSGLPREFDFVLLVHKPDDVRKVFLSVDVDATVEAWFGEYPQWYTNLSRYQPTQDLTLALDTDIGQRFLPSHPRKGFNFADLPRPLQEYVIMPGTVYPANVRCCRQPSSIPANKSRIQHKIRDGDIVVERSTTIPQSATGHSTTAFWTIKLLKLHQRR
jgi:hypothetical protein